MFLGDVGSITLGYFLAILGFWAVLKYGEIMLLLFLLLHANFILDTGITLAIRILHRQKWYEAHNEHFYQRLVKAGKSHTQVTIMESAIQLVTVLILINFPIYSNDMRFFVSLMIIAIWLIFFCYAERMFRAACCSKAAL